MINGEKYKNEIIEEYQNLLKRKVVEGDGNRMNKAIKTIAYKHCKKQLLGASGTFKWLCEEYKEPINLSKLEFEILKFIEFGYIARDKDGNLFSFWYKPKKDNDIWDCDVKKNQNYSHDLTLFNELFDFIKWEDAEPTSIDELLKNCEVVENA